MWSFIMTISPTLYSGFTPEALEQSIYLFLNTSWPEPESYTPSWNNLHKMKPSLHGNHFFIADCPKTKAPLSLTVGLEVWISLYGKSKFHLHFLDKTPKPDPKITLYSGSKINFSLNITNRLLYFVPHNLVLFIKRITSSQELVLLASKIVVHLEHFL
jgi:hypothetical protein